MKNIINEIKEIYDESYLLPPLTIFVGSCLFVGLLCLICSYFNTNKNCHYETYNQYPCEGATHYARVHRNNNEACERAKIICNLIKANLVEKVGE